MKSQSEVARTLEAERQRQKLKYVELAKATGLSVLAVRQALQGKTALRVTSMMALADSLGLELMLLPQVVASSMRGEPGVGNIDNSGNFGDTGNNIGSVSAVTPVLTSVQRALQRQRLASGGV